jgi:phosphatidate cytidylyltransferase
MASNLAQRITFAVIAIPVALAVVWLGGWPLVGLLAIVGALGSREVFDFSLRQQIAPLSRWGVVSAVALPILVYLAIITPGGSVAFLLGNSWFLAALWLVATLTLALARRTPGDRPLAATAITVFAVAYTAGLPATLLPIRHLTEPERSWAGAWLVFTPLVITWVCDTAAMFAGKLIGGPKLWPSISPGKTWSGSVAGVVAALATVPLLNRLVLERQGVALPIAEGLLFGLVLGIVGQTGDLAESLFKREVGVKDSSAIIPGHGGILDRFDSLYFVLPVSAAFYRFVGLI